ncbi:MAG TPA: alpha/beta fold hydrolase [Herpetosiphonaceae bacterium]|nr:alpha/beta fold hydrolase [Herpetosiphonaceae bacterium]
MPTATINGITINYETAGTGEPLLLVMGLGGSLNGWRKQVPALSERFRVIYFDNRGVGLSSAPHEIEAYSMEQFAADAVGLLDHLDIEQAHVWGVSMGGMIAQHIALNHPGRVRGLVLGCTLPHYEPEPQPGDERAPEPWVLELMLSGMTKSREQSIRDSVLFNFAPEFVERRPEIVEEYISEGLRQEMALHGYLGQWNAITRHNTLEHLHSLTHPTLVQHGDRDKLVPIANGRLLAESLPNARFQLIQGSGHVYFLEQFELVNAAVAEFLQTL